MKGMHLIEKAAQTAVAELEAAWLAAEQESADAAEKAALAEAAWLAKAREEKEAFLLAAKVARKAEGKARTAWTNAIQAAKAQKVDLDTKRVEQLWEATWAARRAAAALK